MGVAVVVAAFVRLLLAFLLTTLDQPPAVGMVAVVAVSGRRPLLEESARHLEVGMQATFRRDAATAVAATTITPLTTIIMNHRNPTHTGGRGISTRIVIETNVRRKRKRKTETEAKVGTKTETETETETENEAETTTTEIVTVAVIVIVIVIVIDHRTEMNVDFLTMEETVTATRVTVAPLPTADPMINTEPLQTLLLRTWQRLLHQEQRKNLLTRWIQALRRWKQKLPCCVKC
jgi:hypothetical protein